MVIPLTTFPPVVEPMGIQTPTFPKDGPLDVHKNEIKLVSQEE